MPENGTATTNFMLGAKASMDKEAGSYSNVINFVAVGKVEPPFCERYTCMQDIDSTTLSRLFQNGNKTATVYDERDENKYSVAVLKDGALWMTQNLRLGSDGNTVMLTSDDSNVMNDFSFTSSADWSGIFTSTNVDTAQAYYSRDTGLGSYYNWYTATAGTGDSSTAAEAEAPGSICPKGWVLPNRAEYTMLLAQYSDDPEELWSPAVPNYVITGYYNNTSYGQGTTHTYAWERTAKSVSSGDNMFMRIGKAAATDGMSKYYGMPVRCRLGGDKTSFTVNYHANGGTGTMPSQNTTTGAMTLNANSFTRSGYAFAGWGTDSGDSVPSYKESSTIVSYTDTLDLYAIWKVGQTITFTKDSNVYSIAVLDSEGNTAGTITTSGQSLTLAQGDTYTLKITHTTGYTTNTITKTSGAGTLSDKEFTVGAGSATVNVTSRQMLPMQNYSCSNLANIGDTDMVYDTRDNQTYIVGKLADGNCWLLDNLALDLTDSTVLNGMNESNTHASNTALGYLKNGGGTTSDQYAITGVVNWTDSPTYASGYSYSDPLVNLTNKDVVPTSYNGTDDPMKDAVVAGNWKVGGYYNYCAASAGSYCYGNGTSAGTSSGNAAEDICPKGWRMPTGNSGEYQTLYSNSSYNTYTNYRSALRLPLSGYFNNGSARNQGSNGYWWSSTRSNNGSMYGLTAITSGIYPADIDYRNVGFSVRCVLGS